MAEEIRRRIRWENRERLRKKREEKHKNKDSQHARQHLGDPDVSEPRIIGTTISSTNKAGWLKPTPDDLSVAKNASGPFTEIGRSPDVCVASAPTCSQPLTPTTCRNDKANPEPPEPKLHPTAVKRARTKCLRPTVNFLDDSDDDVDLLRDAMYLAQSRQESDRKRSPKSVRCKAGATKPPSMAAVTMAKSIDDSDSDDDLLRAVMLLQQKRNAGLMETKDARRVPNDEEEKASVHTRENMESQPSFASLQEEEGNADKGEGEPRSPPKDPGYEDSLWDDLENEQPKKEKQFSSKRKRSQLKFRSSNETAGARSTSNRPVRPSASKCSSSSDDEDSIPLDKLMPQFDNPKLGPPSDLVPLVLKYSYGERIVPASINRYLKGYQREGIVFMHNRIAENQGAILGDDMGLGKTIQVISLLAALLKKKGCGEDELQLKKRRKLIGRQLDVNRREQELALRNGNVPELNSHIEGLLIPKWVPILVIVPPSVIENWMNEFEAWGHFGVVAFSGSSKHRALDRIRTGLDEIMVCGKTMLQNDVDLHEIKQIKWKLVIIDEYHQYKNFRTKLYLGLNSLRDTCSAPLVGLTGTLMQNNHEELWSEVDLVNPGFLGTWEEFKDDTSVPIKLGRTKTADDAAVEEGNQVRDWLKTKLKSFYLQRRKIDVLKDDLPEKNERVVFCELSPLQKRLYQHLMTLPDFVLVKYGNAPCECGINQAIFQGFKQMRTEKEKIAYQRNHRDDIVPRKSCCHKRPLNYFRFEAGEEFYDPRAPLWRWQHEKLVNGEEEGAAECKGCPYCISFSVLDKLYKLSSHVSLLQLPKHPKDYTEGSRAWKDAQKGLDFAKVAFPDDVLELLPGGSYIREDGIMDDHSNLSGKMKILADLLIEFNRRDDRLLIFSFSTQTLDLIQNFIKAQGYSFLRLDGSTPAKARQGLVDNYQKNKNIFLFLISTKAGGLGLNLTAANVVIVFDVDFNPSHDEQSQDRAYRIGQKRDVLVIRLVSRGTIEELKYIRQLYKLQLKNYTIGSVQGEQSSEDAEAARMFRAVEGDKDRKGELFGMENLLKFKDGSFMDDLWKPSREGSGFKGLERFGLRSAIDMAGRMEGMSEERINEVGGNIVDESFREAALKTGNCGGASHDARLSVDVLLHGGNSKSHGDYLRADRGDALFKRGDQGFDEEMGGYSQAEHYVMENAEIDDRVDNPVPTSLVSNARTYEPSPKPSPVRSLPRLAPCTRVLETIDVTPAFEDRPAPAYDGVAERCVPNVPNETIEAKPKRSVTSGGKGSGAILSLGNKGSSVFSSKDLYIPGRKMKKKNRIISGVYTHNGS